MENRCTVLSRITSLGRDFTPSTEQRRKEAPPSQQAQRCLAHGFSRRSYRSGEEVRVVLRDETGGHVPSLKLRVARETQQKVDVRVQANDLRTEDANKSENGSDSVYSLQFTSRRSDCPAIVKHHEMGGEMQQRPRPREEVVVGVLGIDTSLKRVSTQNNVILEERQPLPRCHLEENYAESHQCSGDVFHRPSALPVPVDFFSIPPLLPGAATPPGRSQ
ncbi:hypothetical protein EYF80_036711 [Liparis tanakae]|uniref:Uncharacterized protein n=1 Tax=Liparis tanakae TaxID=230148 RepID=A0A4Z2GI13_9TELE|nr:hypothetical protein EYF80_036711 [Liparis tanakae]